MPISEDVETEGWAVFFGMFTGAIGFIQLGEALYRFVDMSFYVKDEELKRKMYALSMQQLILTGVAVLLGIVALLFWKAEKVSRNTVKFLAFLNMAAAGYAGYMVWSMYNINQENPNPKTVEEQLLMDRYHLLMTVNIALTVMFVATGGLMFWISRHYQKKP